MLIDKNQTVFKSPLHEQIWSTARCIVPFEISTAGITDTALLEGFRQIYDFNIEFFSDMCEDPDKYKLQELIYFDNGIKIRSVNPFHEYLYYRLINTKKVRLIGSDWAISAKDMTPLMYSELWMIDLLAPMGIYYEKNDENVLIKSSKYPLLLKYFSICHELSQKLPKSRIQGTPIIALCDFRFLYKRFVTSIDDVVWSFSDRDRTYAVELHEFLASKKIKHKPGVYGYGSIHYEYKKQPLLSISIHSKAADFPVTLGQNPEDEKYKYMISEIYKLSNRDELLKYISDNIYCCTYCGYGASVRSCRGYNRDFFGEQKFLCGAHFMLSIKGNKNRSKYYNDNDIKMLKEILDLRIKAIDNVIS